MVGVQSVLSEKKSRWVRKRDNSKWDRRRRSLWHRLVCGVKRARFLKRQLWFITLTTSVECREIIEGCKSSVRDVFKRHFSSFVKRCRRTFGRFEYIAVHTDEGYGVYHLLVNSVSIGNKFTYGGFCGYKAFWLWLSDNWFEIHYSPVVWSVLVRGVRKAVNYVCRYVHTQDNFLRYHWSAKWVFRGFITTWKYHLKNWKDKDGMIPKFKEMLSAWDKLLYRKVFESVSNQLLLAGAVSSI